MLRNTRVLPAALPFACMLLSLFAPSAGASRIACEVRGGRETVAARVEIGVPDAASQAKIVEVECPGSVEIEASPGPLAKIRTTAAGYWSREVVAELGTEEDVKVLLVQMGELRRELGIEGRAPPEKVRVELYEQDDLQSATVAVGRFPCEIEIKLVRCQVPSGEWQVKLVAEGYSAAYDWDVAIPSGGTRILPPAILRQGSSVTGFVSTCAHRAEDVECRVELESYDFSLRRIASGEGSIHKQEGTVDARGFFQLTGVAPGKYAISAFQTGLSPARHFPVPVFQGAETRLAAALEPGLPASLELMLTPPLDPAGEPWLVSLSLRGYSEAMLQVAEMEPTQGGFWTSPALEPGRYMVGVSDSQRSSWRVEDLEVFEPGQRLEMDFDLLDLRGTVLLGDRPLAARIELAGVRTTSDANGEFRVTLPRAEGWPVRVVSEDPPVSRRLHLKAPEGEDELVLRLGSRTVRGVVKDAKGSPVDKARIVVMAVDDLEVSFDVRSTEDGSFEVHGLEEVETQFQAHLDAARSQVETVELAHRDDAEIELVLRENRLIRGTLGAAGDPVPGGVISVFFAGEMAAGNEVTTDTRGRFEFSASNDSTSAYAVIYPPGRGLDVRILALPAAGAELAIPMPAAFGTLELQGLDRQGRETASPSVPVLFKDGLSLPLPVVVKWLSLNNQSADTTDGSLQVPGMAPGRYALCVRDVVQVLKAGAERRPSGVFEDCAQGTLATGAHLVLDLGE